MRNILGKAGIIDLPRVLDARGNLSFIEELNHIPFRIERCYWIYDVPGGEKRGGHSFYKNEELIIALSGSFDVVLDNGYRREIISLNRSFYGLFVPKLFWREIENFSTNSLAFILSSSKYDPDDYIRDYEIFKNLINK